MTLKDGSMQEVFGSAWDVLSADHQQSYEAAIKVQHARIMLGFGAMFGAMQQEVTPEFYDVLSSRLVGRHLTELEMITSTVEDLAAKLDCPPYGGEDPQATVRSLFGVPTSKSSNTGSGEPVDQIVVESSSLLETKIKPENDPISEIQTTDSMEPGTTPETTQDRPQIQKNPEFQKTLEEDEQYATLRRFLKTIHKGLPTSDMLDHLTTNEAQELFNKIMSNYAKSITRRNSKRALEGRIVRLQQSIGGLSDDEIAQSESMSKLSLHQERFVLFKAIRGRLLIEHESMNLSTVEKAEVSKAAISDAGNSPESEVNAEAQKDVQPIDHATKLVEAVQILGDRLGFDKRQKHGLLQRLDERWDTTQLTNNASQALNAIATKYNRLNERGYIQLEDIEKSILMKVTGLDPSAEGKLPIKVAVKLMSKEFPDDARSSSEILQTVLNKIIEADNVSRTRP